MAFETEGIELRLSIWSDDLPPSTVEFRSTVLDWEGLGHVVGYALRAVQDHVPGRPRSDFFLSGLNEIFPKPGGESNGDTRRPG